MTGGCCDKCDLLQTKVLLTSIPFNSLPTPTYTPLHPCSKPCCNSSLVTLFKTVWYFFSPLLQNENVFPSLHFSLVRIYRNRKDWDLANTGDARPEKWACSLKLLHTQGFVDWSVIMMQNTWLVLSQMRSFFLTAWLEFCSIAYSFWHSFVVLGDISSSFVSSSMIADQMSFRLTFWYWVRYFGTIVKLNYAIFNSFHTISVNIENFLHFLQSPDDRTLIIINLFSIFKKLVCQWKTPTRKIILSPNTSKYSVGDF